MLNTQQVLEIFDFCVSYAGNILWIALSFDLKLLFFKKWSKELSLCFPLSKENREISVFVSVYKSNKYSKKLTQGWKLCFLLLQIR